MVCQGKTYVYLSCMLFSDSSSSFLHLKEKVLFYKSKNFQHFDYLCNLIRNCSSRVRKIPNMDRETQVPSSDMVKIRYIGHVTADNMKFVSKRKRKVFMKIIAFLILVILTKLILE